MGREDINGFIQWLEQNERSENTISCYTDAVKIFFAHFDSVTKKNMIAFKGYCLDQYCAKTASNRCIAMNQFCKYLGKTDCIVKTIKIQKQLSVENVVTLDQYTRLLQCLQEDGKEKTYWMIKFLAKTGARVSEFVRFERKHLEAGEATMWTKGKMRRILIPKSLVDESKEYFAKQPGSKWLFPNRYGKQMSSRGVAEAIKRCKKYGIPEEVLHPHAFRHLYAMQFLKKNGNLTLLSDLMGHESIETTSIYLRMSQKEQRAAFEEASSW